MPAVRTVCSLLLLLVVLAACSAGETSIAAPAPTVDPLATATPDPLATATPDPLATAPATLSTATSPSAAGNEQTAPTPFPDVVITPSPDSPAPQPVPITAPGLVPGGVGAGTVEIAGTPIDYVVVTPAGFTPGMGAPVLLAFPPGGQDLTITANAVTAVYAQEAVRLGWVVISPAAPSGVRFFDGSERLIPGFLDWVETWVAIEGGAPHVAGMSNGGISSFRYATENPGRVRSLIAFPGFPSSDQDRAGLEGLRRVPIRLYVGGADGDWVTQSEATEALIASVGGNVSLTVFPNEGHIIDSTSDGRLIFEQLQQFRTG